MESMGFGNQGTNLRVILTVFAMFIAALAFQNCGMRGLEQIDLGELKLDVGSGSTQGNGSGYDGKLYVHLATTESCADSLGFDRAIAGRNGKFYLTRDNCQDIAETAQIEVQVETNPANPTRIYFENQIFVERLEQIGNLEKLGDGFLATGTQYSVIKGALQYDGKFVSRYDQEGRPVWSKRFQFDPMDVVKLGYSHMQPLKDGGVVLTGGYGESRYPASNDLATTWLARFAPDGKLLWNKRIDQNGSKAARFKSIRVDGSDNIYALIAVEKEGDLPQMLIAKFGPNGEILFAKSLAGTARTIEISPAGGIYVVNFVDGFGNLVRLSSTGETLFSKHFDGMGSGSLYGGLYLAFAKDGTLILSGNKLIPNPDYPTFLEGHGRILQLSSSGELKSTHKFAEKMAIQSPPLIAGDGFVLSIVDANAVRFARYQSDFTLDWAFRKDETPDFRSPSFERLRDGSFVLVQNKIASNKMYSSHLLTLFDLGRPEISCPSCVVASMPDIVPTDDISIVSEGPHLEPHTGLSSVETAPIPFESTKHYLPLEKDIH